MTAPAVAIPLDLETRARQSLGVSHAVIYTMVADAIGRHRGRGRLLDVGCGRGDLRPVVERLVTSYEGVDAVRYEAWPVECEFRHADLDCDEWPGVRGHADVVVAVETIEHLENPRALFREMARVLRPGGYLVVSTPNQISALSILSLVVKGQFVAFQDASYPAHRVALLPVDLERLAIESGLEPREVRYTCHGRIPLTRRHYPLAVSHLFPRRLSDNVLLLARKPA